MCIEESYDIMIVVEWIWKRIVMLRNCKGDSSVDVCEKFVLVFLFLNSLYVVDFINSLIWMEF